MTRPLAMTWMIGAGSHRSTSPCWRGGGGRGRKGREEDGEGKGLNVTCPKGEA